MKIEQIYTGCLSQGAYYIESAGEVAIVDPLREVKGYIDKAARHSASIKYVFETHFHADFVSGHLDLAEKTGASIIYGPGANPGFEAHIAFDGEEFKLGEVTIRAIHTPGHTMESTCFLLLDEQGVPVALFSGDTLFIGDVGRPDLAQTGELTKEELAGYLYDSLREKIMVLPDHLIVYPAHGAGSACGKNISRQTSDTLGNQKKINYALQENLTRAAFIEEATRDLEDPPQYFPENVRMNKEGYDRFEDVMERGTRALSPEAFERLANASGALVLDTRHFDQFSVGFIPNSINIGIDGGFAPWVGALIPDLDQPLLIVSEPGKEAEVVTRLSRVGYDHAIGYLDGGFQSWKAAGREVDTVENISATALEGLLAGESPVIVDVRKPAEFEVGHIQNAINIPLEHLNEELESYPQDGSFYLHCAGGYRSMIAGSILKARGYDNLVNIRGGFSEIVKTNIPLSLQPSVD